ncbi:MAG: hypothetical protein GX141_09815 [Armatimonadetes bacterium]|nr:hypothetical protein [Armatimonadota bacterium]
MKPSAVLALALIGLMVGVAVNAEPSTVVDITLKDVSVKQAIDTLFTKQGLKYYIQPGVGGRIAELRLKGITFDEALSALGGAAGFSYRIDDGAYIITPGKAAEQPARIPQPLERPVEGRGPAEKQTPTTSPAPVVVNNNITMPEQPAAPSQYYPPDYGPQGYMGGWWPTVNLGSGPYVFGRWAQPPPPLGWVSADQQRLLRFQYSVPRMPGYMAPFPYFRP